MEMVCIEKHGYFISSEGKKIHVCVPHQKKKTSKIFFVCHALLIVFCLQISMIAEYRLEISFSSKSFGIYFATVSTKILNRMSNTSLLNFLTICFLSQASARDSISSRDKNEEWFKLNFFRN